MYLGGPDQYMKKVNGQWRYYPKTVAIDEYSLEIRAGKEHEVRQIIDGTSRFLLGMSSVLVGAMILADRGFIWGFVFCCVFYPYRIYRRVKSINKLCVDFENNKFRGNYFVTVYRLIDEHNFRSFFLFLIMFVVFAATGYDNFQSKAYLKASLAMVPCLLAGGLLALFVVKRYRRSKEGASRGGA